MDFLVCKSGLLGLEIHVALEEVKDQEEAISKAKDIALHTKEGFTVGLFTREGDAICGWKVLAGGKLRKEDISVIRQKCFVGPGSFESAKRHGERLRKASAKKK
jgi:translation initiation factor IF-2